MVRIVHRMGRVINVYCSGVTYTESRVKGNDVVCYQSAKQRPQALLESPAGVN